MNPQTTKRCVASGSKMRFCLCGTSKPHITDLRGTRSPTSERNPTSRKETLNIVRRQNIVKLKSIEVFWNFSWSSSLSFTFTHTNISNESHRERSGSYQGKIGQRYPFYFFLSFWPLKILVWISILSINWRYHICLLQLHSLWHILEESLPDSSLDSQT